MADTKAAVDMLATLATVEPAQRLDTLALAVKVFIEAGNQWSPLRDLWNRIEVKCA